MFKNCLKIPLKLKKYKNYEIIKVEGKKIIKVLIIKFLVISALPHFL